MQSQVKIKEIKTLTFPNAIVRIHIPDIAEEEREKRLKEIHRAAEMILRSQEYGTVY